MKIPRKVVDEVEANAVHIYLKVRDEFSATLCAAKPPPHSVGGDGCKLIETDIATQEDGYVPGWMPGEHYGDYVDLLVDLDSGRILNWKKPDALELAKTFFPDKNDER